MMMNHLLFSSTTTHPWIGVVTTFFSLLLPMHVNMTADMLLCQYSGQIARDNFHDIFLLIIIHACQYYIAGMSPKAAPVNFGKNFHDIFLLNITNACQYDIADMSPKAAPVNKDLRR